jgi:hypothetical protein
VILGSDKTTVSVGTGHTEYYPLYLSNGQVHNNVRRAHRNAVALIGFLAIPKSMSLILRVFFKNLWNIFIYNKPIRSMQILWNFGNSGEIFSMVL